MEPHLNDITGQTADPEAENGSDNPGSAVSASGDYFRLIFETSPDGILMTTPDGSIYRANQAAEKILGYSEEEICRLGRKGIVDQTDPNLTLALAERNEKGTFQKQLKMVKKDGSLITVDASGGILKLKDGSLGSCVIFRDVTDKIRAQDALADALELNNKIFENSTAGIAVYNISGQCILANDKFGQIIGATKQQVLAQNFREIRSWKQYGLIETAEEVLAGGAHISRDMYVVTTFGKEIWIEVNALRFSSKNEPHLLLTLNDITPRKLAEISLKRSDVLTKSILNSLSSYVAVINKEGIIIEINKAWESFEDMNITRSRLNLGDNYLQSCSNAVAEYGEAADAFIGIEKVLRGMAGEFSIEYCWCVREQKRWFLMNVTPLAYGGATISHTDITAGKISEEAALKNERLLQTVIDILPAGVFVADKGGKIFLTNEEVGKIWGGKRHVDISQYNEYKGWWYDTGERISSEQWALARAITNGETSLNEVVRIECFDGERKIIQCSTVPILGFDDEVTGGVTVIQDITRQKKIETELKDLNAGKDKFFNIIAHDLKSPFSSLIGFSQFLANDFDQLSQEEIRNFTSSIYKSAKSVFNLLENLLQWARLQTGKMEYSPVRFNLKDLIDEGINIFQINALRKNISIENKCVPDIFVYADRNMIDGVIRNFLSNAIKFSHQGGIIEVTSDRKPDEAVITVTDYGIGIEDEALKKLFQLGESITTRGTNNEKGTGLGLILCREFIEKNSGVISIESRTGQGTAISFTLPLFTSRPDKNKKLP